MKNQSNQVKERPIIFSGEMVKAILDGKKTMTRHLVKFKDFTTDSITPLHIELAEGRYCLFNERNGWLIGYPKCKFGEIGDRLWVRETWQEIGPDCLLTYKATYPSDLYAKRPELENVPPLAGLKERGYLWKSPMLMPRWASRILLEIIDIRVERLQDISEADALKEGIRNYNFEMEDSPDTYVGYTHLQKDDGKSTLYKTPAIAFERLWDTLNAKKGYPWSSNPWVWVVEFKVIEVA